ncbi:MAG: AAA family ATPase [Deltaproteobacteria bacterium]|nr:AAA family ATPase [Deltaproteobacteria bacterium]
MIHAFDVFELDDEHFELRRAGVPVPLQRKTFDLLLYFVRSEGRSVTREELFRDVWNGVVVTERALTQAVLTVRRALGDDGNDPTMLLTVRGRGYRFAARVTSRSSPARVTFAPREEGRELPFVGRDEPLERIEGALRQAREGRGTLVAIVGDRGLGKSRLLEEVARRAPDTRVLVGRCFEAEGAPPLWPWVQIARRLHEAGAANPLLEEAEELESPSARFRFGDRLVARVREEAASSSVLVAIEDAQWIDAASLQLIRHFAEELASSRTMLVVTARSPAERALGALARFPRALVVELARLDRSAMEAFVTSVTGRPAEPGLVAHLLEKTAGNPSLIAPLVDVIRATMSVADEPGTTALLGAAGVRGVVADQVASLDAELERALGVAAVFGLSFKLAPLAAVLGEEREALALLLDRALAARVVSRAAPAEYRFLQPLVRDALYRAIPEGERLRLHRAVGRVLTTLLGGDTAGAHALEIVPHLVEAAALGDAEEAVRAALAAASDARAAGDGRAAARFAELAERAIVHVSAGAAQALRAEVARARATSP